MLHIESWQGRKESFNPLVAIVFLLLLLAGCEEKVANTNKNITMEAFSDLRTPVFALDYHQIMESMRTICLSDRDSMTSDYRARSYYLNGGVMLWVDRAGVDSRADTLLKTLETVGDMGFMERAFFVDIIKKDLSRMRDLDFDNEKNSINHVVARLEYNLTKAYLRYSTGQSFGFVNPLYLFNNLDVLDEDSSGNVLSYRRLFDIDIKRPGKDFFRTALRHVYSDSVGEFLRECQPVDSLYFCLKRRLESAATHNERVRILCNMERCRWREKGASRKNGKYVVVNIPAYHLYAFGGEALLEMRIGCGTRKTKTPLLTSAIERMDVNPVWNIPMSIIKHDIVPRLGDTAYFRRNRYYVVCRKTGEKAELSDVTAERLRDGTFRVVQEGGEGNSLGRIVFRFANNFSVFLHDTSSRGVFSRNNRSVSHGCVRVQKPFELASFLIGESDDWTLDKLRISMGMEPETDKGIRYIENENNNRNLVRSLTVSPPIPLYITYYTIYPGADGVLESYPDVYGYDDVIYNKIKPFME